MVKTDQVQEISTAEIAGNTRELSFKIGEIVGLDRDEAKQWYDDSPFKNKYRPCVALVTAVGRLFYDLPLKPKKVAQNIKNISQKLDAYREWSNAQRSSTYGKKLAEYFIDGRSITDLADQVCDRACEQVENGFVPDARRAHIKDLMSFDLYFPDQSIDAACNGSSSDLDTFICAVEEIAGSSVPEAVCAFLHEAKAQLGRLPLVGYFGEGSILADFKLSDVEQNLYIEKLRLGMARDIASSAAAQESVGMVLLNFEMMGPLAEVLHSIEERFQKFESKEQCELFRCLVSSGTVGHILDTVQATGMSFLESLGEQGLSVPRFLKNLNEIPEQERVSTYHFLRENLGATRVFIKAQKSECASVAGNLRKFSTYDFGKDTEGAARVIDYVTELDLSDKNTEKAAIVLILQLPDLVLDPKLEDVLMLLKKSNASLEFVQAYLEIEDNPELQKALIISASIVPSSREFISLKRTLVAQDSDTLHKIASLPQDDWDTFFRGVLRLSTPASAPEIAPSVRRSSTQPQIELSAEENALNEILDDCEQRASAQVRSIFSESRDTQRQFISHYNQESSHPILRCCLRDPVLFSRYQDFLRYKPSDLNDFLDNSRQVPNPQRAAWVFFGSEHDYLTSQAERVDVIDQDPSHIEKLNASRVIVLNGRFSPEARKVLELNLSDFEVVFHNESEGAGDNLLFGQGDVVVCVTSCSSHASYYRAKAKASRADTPFLHFSHRSPKILSEMLTAKLLPISS